MTSLHSKNNLKVLIMAGGSGERFWPLSTKEKPKQLLKLLSEKSMIRETVDRVLRLVSIEDVFVATNEIQVNGLKNEIPELIDENIIVEPEFRDTAAAIAYGSTYIARYVKNPLIVVLASDHLIKKVDNFISSLKIAEKEAKKDFIVTLGVNPTRPETGYGYIRLKNLTINKVSKVISFIEKPCLEKAKKYLSNRNYVWNSGIFVFKYNTIINEFKKFIPNHIDVLDTLREDIQKFSGIALSNIVKKKFNLFDKISIDYAVIEKSNKIKCIAVDMGWSDVGGFNSLEDLLEYDEENNVVKNAKYVSIDSNNNIIISESNNKIISTIGIKNTIIVNSKNGILVCKKSEAQRVKEIIKIL